MQVELSILTLNVWGIPFVSKDLDVRMSAIGNFLAENEYDLVSLQEVWTETDYQIIRKIAEQSLPFSHYFYSGVFGSGLCILSKHPILMTFFHAWSVNGYVHRIHHGDWFGGKGVGLCKILVQDKYPVNVYIAHLHAEYDRESDDYNAHRVVQAYDTAQFIESTRGDSVLQVLAGDLNAEPGDLAYRILMVASGLRETYNEADCGEIGTNECDFNTYTQDHSKEKSPMGKRIDYILYRSGINHEAKVLEYKLPLPLYIPEQKISYSDHEAVHARISVEHQSPVIDLNGAFPSSHNATRNDFDYSDTLNEGIEVCEQILTRLHSDKNCYFIMALLLLVPLFFFIDYRTPFGFGMPFLLVKILFIGFIIFFVFMATLWNSIERNGILSTKLSMEMARTATAHYYRSHSFNVPCDQDAPSNRIEKQTI